MGSEADKKVDSSSKDVIEIKPNPIVTKGFEDSLNASFEYAGQLIYITQFDQLQNLYNKLTMQEVNLLLNEIKEGKEGTICLLLHNEEIRLRKFIGDDNKIFALMDKAA